MTKTVEFERFQRADGLWNFIKPDGTFLCEEWFEWVGPFSEGLAEVQRTGGVWNFIKLDGKFLCEEWFKWVEPFSGGFAEVQRADGLWNFIRYDGTFLYKEWYEYERVGNGLVQVEKTDNLWKLIKFDENFLGEQNKAEPVYTSAFNKPKKERDGFIAKVRGNIYGVIRKVVGK